MGNGIAHTFAQNNFNVKLVDISEDSLKKAIDKIENNLDRMVKKEKITNEEKTKTLNNITTYNNIEEGVKDSDLVVEAATENLELKLNIFSKIDKLCNKNTILASNTSSISITEIANATNRKDKVIGMHFMNPVPIMKLVEVIRGKSTSDEVTQKIMDISKSLYKVPVEVNDAPGFVANRILMPMINEAIFCLEQNVAEKEAIDEIMKLGMSHPMGPLQLADFIGLDVCLDIMEVLWIGFNDSKYRPCTLLKTMVSSGLLGKKSGRGFYKYD